MNFENTLDFAKQCDQNDPLAHFRNEFNLPKTESGETELYFCGNSLGCQPKRTQAYIQKEMDKWASGAVKGHFTGEFPWMPYHEFLLESSAQLIGAKTQEVVTMNTLTVNLHLMMVSFYQPTAERFKIVIEDHAFPSDHYAVESQIRHHGFDPKDAMILIKPRAGEETIREEDLYQVIAEQGDSIALVMFPGVQYYTGQVFDMKTITEKAHQKGIKVGFDLAHATGNIEMHLHDWNVDFACWCTYKYLNSGPGSVAGCFVHEKHGQNTDLNRFAGWWGHDKDSRFKMINEFKAIPTAEGWQLSNPPILSLAAINASLSVFKDAGYMKPLCAKSAQLTGYMEWLLKEVCGKRIDIITPSNPKQRGSQLSLKVALEGRDGKTVFDAIEAQGVTADWRHPNVIRVAPTALYNSFEDVYRFVHILHDCLEA
jgi:kynureninase